jgi:outer membrane protein insertion porin family
MNKQTRWWPLLIMAVTLALGAVSVWAQEDQPPAGPIVRVIDVRFVGPESVNPTVVRANIQTTVGQALSRQLVEQDVRSLINTGFFADVRVLEEPAADGVKIVFQVQGKAKIKDIIIEGNKHYKSDRLLREVTQKPGDILSEHQARLEAGKIEELYQKAAYPDVKVTPEINIDKDTGRAVLRFKVVEGDRVFLQKVIFAGNKSIKSGVLLKQMKTKKYWWASWLTGGGTLKQEQYQADLEKLREFYWSKGYMDAEIREAKIERAGKKWIVVRLTIFEGQQYKIGTVKIEGAKLFPVAELQKKLSMGVNAVFTPQGQQKDAKAIEDYYGSRGYLDTSVRATRIPNVETGRLDLLYTIVEGQLCFIERIDIRGNTKTKDKVIRRELAVNPGDTYDTVRVERSEARLKNLGYFSKVETTPEPTAVPNRKNLGITVEEQRTGNITFGAGFSTIDSLLGFVEVTQGNFDMFNWPTFTGAGQKMRVRAQMGLQRQDFVLSFTEPWFMDRQLSVGFDIFHRFSGYLSDSYEERRTGGTLRLGKAISPFLRLDTAFTVQYISQKLTDPAVSEEIRSQSGDWLRNSLSATLTYDTRDNVFLTSRGQRTEFTAELVGGPIGGDLSLYKLNARSSWFFPIFKGHILQLVAEGAVVDAFGKTRGSGGSVTETVVTGGVTNFVPVQVNDVPIFDRYFLGGANSLRGFDYRKVGPKDVFGEPVGGNTMVDATIEYTIPVIERIRLAFFFDIGQVDAKSYHVDFDEFKADVGAGVRLNLPVGPLRLDYGWPIITDRLSGRVGRIQFSVGYQF